MRRFAIILLLLPLLFAACEEGYLQDPEPTRIVVEGWIESNGYPVVLLTRTSPITTDTASFKNLEGLIGRYARVTVSNGSKSVILTSTYDPKYLPPYYYTTTKMKGEVGKTYTLTVELDDQVLTAETHIPDKPVIDSVRVEKSIISDSLYLIKLCFTDDPNKKNYYQTFVRVGINQTQYASSYLGCYDDEQLTNPAEIPVYRGDQLRDTTYQMYYHPTDSVIVKFCGVDEFGYHFWKSFNESKATNQNGILFSNNSLPTNIEGGGLGYWVGYGMTSKVIYIEKYIK